MGYLVLLGALMIGDKHTETPFEKRLDRSDDGSTKKNGVRFPSRIWIQEASSGSAGGLLAAPKRMQGPVEPVMV